jgi:hypothetical protein
MSPFALIRPPQVDSRLSLWNRESTYGGPMDTNEGNSSAAILFFAS